MEENTQMQATEGPNEQTKTPGYMLTLYFELHLYFLRENILISCEIFALSTLPRPTNCPWVSEDDPRCLYLMKLKFTVSL